MAPPMVQLYHNRNVNKNSLLFKVDYISMDNSPVYYAVHGEGEWEFEKDSESLEEFFEFLGIR